MPLTLTIMNAGHLDNGSPRSLVLDRRGALIGRAATSDWCLPDPSLHISSRHCEIRFTGERYELHDLSTNGTFLRGHASRLPGPHMIRPGDVFTIGPFEIAAALDDAAAASAQAANAAPPTPEWKGWAANGDAAPPVSESAWDRRPAGAAITGSGAMSQVWAPPPSTGAASSGWGSPPAPEPSQGASGWGAPPAPAPSSWGSTPAATEAPAAGGWGTPPPPVATPPSSSWGAPPSAGSASSSWGAPPPTPAAEPPSPSTWDVAPAAPGPGPSAWSASPTPPPPPGADDIWGKFAASNVVDWARGGFGKPSDLFAAPLSTPAASSAPATPAPTPAWGAPPAEAGTAFTAESPAAAPIPTPVPTAGSLAPLTEALGVPADKLQLGDEATLGITGNLLRRLIAGLVVMLEARARAKSQLGAAGTSLEFAGNNPLKFARTPEQALTQLLNEPQRGFMGSDQAIEDAFKDLQAHQMATLAAMQGALRATLDRFSPGSIRKRAESGGFLSKVLPGAKDAALWKAYEREFSGVAQGSDEAFMDVFAKEFRKAYEEAARK